MEACDSDIGRYDDAWSGNTSDRDGAKSGTECAESRHCECRGCSLKIWSVMLESRHRTFIMICETDFLLPSHAFVRVANIGASEGKVS